LGRRIGHRIDVALDTTPRVDRMMAVASLLDRLGRILLVLVAIIGVLAVVPALAVGLVGSWQVGSDASTASMLCWQGDCQAQGLANLAGSTLVVVSAVVIILVRRSGSGSPGAGVIAGSIIAGASLGLLLVSKPRINLAAAGVFAAAFGLASAAGSGLRLVAGRIRAGTRRQQASGGRARRTGEQGGGGPRDP
jgi:hypothetical protein